METTTPVPALHLTPPDTAGLNLLIDGQWHTGRGQVLKSFNPARPGEVVAEGPTAVVDDLERAMAAARKAQRDWARTPQHERGAVLLRAAEHVDAHAPAWGLELSREEGKTLSEGVGEVRRAAQILRYFGNEGDRQAGELFSSPRRGERIMVTRKPLGVVGVVTPFNFPMAIPAWKIAPALAYGNCVVWKPASTVPLLAMRLAQALQSAGLPDGVLNLMIGPGSLGGSMAEHPGLDGLTFTGSTGVGRGLAAKAAERGVPIQAEMGGKNAAIVLKDADLEVAAEQVLLGAFRSTGQKCTATSRLIVDDSVAGELYERLQQALRHWTVGDPTDPSTDMGPLVTPSAAETVRSGVRTALDEGARLRTGGPCGDRHRDVVPVAETSSFLTPTILEIPRAQPVGLNSAWREEYFGPVLTVRRAAGPEEAFALANDSEFGLSAAVFTQDITRVLDAIDEIDVGILHVNSESAGADPHVPFGGAKKSGYGPKEQGTAAKEFFTHTTTVYLRGSSRT